MKNSKLNQWLEDEDYFSKLAVLSLGPLHPFASYSIESLGELAQSQGGRVLEVGMGTGWTHRYLNSKKISVFSVERNEFMIDAATLNGVDPTQVAHKTIEAWASEPPEQSFATICFQAVLGFTERPLKVLDQCLNKSGAKAVHIVDWHPESTRESTNTTPVVTSEIIDVLEQHGLTFLNVETREYISHTKKLTTSEALERVLMHFPEAGEWRCEERIIEKVKDLVDIGKQKRIFQINASK